MTRQNFLQLALSLSVAGGSLLTGCGSWNQGGGGGGSIATRSVTGALALPEGFSLSAGELRVETGHGSAAVGGDGAFSVPIAASSAPTLAWARTAERVLLAGFLSEGGGTIGVRSTALALLYLALGGASLPAENTAHLLPLLDAHPAMGPLVATMTARLAASPSAVEDGDEELARALKTALDAVLADRPKSTRAERTPGGRATRAVGNALLLTSPTGFQSNVELLQGTAPQTVVVKNHGRRFCKVYVYEVGKENKEGVRTDYPAAKPISSVSLKSTAALGFTSTIFGFSSDQTAFVPVSTDPLPLAIAADAKKALYEIVVLGSSSLIGDPPIYTDPRYAAAVEEWREARLLLNLTSWFYDVIFGLFLEIWGLRSAVEIDFAGIQEAVATLRKLQVASWGEVVVAVTAGKFDLATYLFLRACASDARFFLLISSILVKLSPALQKLLSKEAVVASGQLVTKFFSGMLAPSNVVGLFLGAGDLLATLSDLATAQQADRWQATLITGEVSLTPVSSTISAGGSQSFTASVPAAPTAPYRYLWSVAGSDLVSLADAKEGKAGKSFETTGSVVSLATTPSTQGTLTVTVQAFEIGTGGERISRGTAAASVTVEKEKDPPFGSVVATLSNAPGPDLDPALKRELGAVRAQQVPPTLGAVRPILIESVHELVAGFGPQNTQLFMNLDFGDKIVKDQVLPLDFGSNRGLSMRVGGPTTGGARVRFIATGGSLKVLSASVVDKTAIVRFQASASLVAQDDPGLTFSATFDGWISDIKLL